MTAYNSLIYKTKNRHFRKYIQIGITSLPATINASKFFFSTLMGIILPCNIHRRNAAVITFQYPFLILPFHESNGRMKGS